MAYKPLDYTPDDSLILQSGTTLAAAGTAVGSTVTLGAGYCQFDVVIDITAQDVAGTDDACTFTLEGSIDGFTNIAILGTYVTGNATAMATLTGSTVNAAKGIGQHVMPCHNIAALPSSPPFTLTAVRLRHRVAGATVAMTYSARIVKRA